MNDAERDKLERLREMSHEWHVAINRFHDTIPHGEWRHWMYEAKDAMHEIPRLAYLHGAERMGKLAKLHQHCSRSPTEPVPFVPHNGLERVQ